MSPELEAYRRHLLDQLAALDRAHREAAAPIMRRLVEIEARQPPKPFVMLLGDIPEGVQQLLKQENEK